MTLKRDDIIQQIRAQRAKLTALHVTSLAIFGSVARDQARPDSDVDMLVEFDGPATFDRYMDLKELLERTLGRRVDLLTRKAIRPELAPTIEREAVHVA